jgi:hypothetical protein
LLSGHPPPAHCDLPQEQVGVQVSSQTASAALPQLEHEHDPPVPSNQQPAELTASHVDNASPAQFHVLAKQEQKVTIRLVAIPYAPVDGAWPEPGFAAGVSVVDVPEALDNWPSVVTHE